MNRLLLKQNRRLMAWKRATMGAIGSAIMTGNPARLIPNAPERPLKMAPLARQPTRAKERPLVQEDG